MSEGAISNTKQPRGRPFEPGNNANPNGRPKGSRNKAILAMEALLDGEAEGLTRRAIEMALAGDTAAMRLCLDRLVPPRRDRPVRFALPPIETVGDATGASVALVAAVANGDLTPGEASEVAKLIETHVKILEAVDFEQRLAALEAAR